jgi:hypothetical protein
VQSIHDYCFMIVEIQQLSFCHPLLSP